MPTPLAVWTERSGYSFGEIQERRTCNIALPVENDNGVTYSVIAGNLPSGLVLTGRNISGVPYQITKTSNYEFCIRAALHGAISDRTFNVVVIGPPLPVIETPGGYLNLGLNQNYVLGGAYIDFQFSTIDYATAAGQHLSYFISDNCGELPPVLTLSTTGKLFGFVEPILPIPLAAGNGAYDMPLYDAVPYDYAVIPNNGYDSYLYDNVYYDYSTPNTIPQYVNRNYEFIISVTNGDQLTKKQFGVLVVGDDFFRSDNVLLDSDSLIFTADCTFIRSLPWKTPFDLGSYRANNYVTVPLTTYETLNVMYDIMPVNATSLVMAHSIFHNNYITATTGTLATTAHANSTVICTDTSLLTQFMPIIFQGGTTTQPSINVTSDVIILSPTDLITGSIVNFIFSNPINTIGGNPAIEVGTNYFITNILDQISVFTYTNVTSVGLTVTISDTTGLYPGLEVSVVSGTGKFAAHTSIIRVLTSTTFFINHLPTIDLLTATIDCTISGISVSSTVSGSAIQFAPGPVTLIANIETVVGGLLPATPYYVAEIYDSTHFSISQTLSDVLAGTTVVLTTTSGIMAILAVDNVKHYPSVTITTTATDVFQYQYFTFDGVIAGGSGTTFQILDVALIATNTYRLIIDQPLDINIPDNLYFYIGSLCELPDGMIFDRESCTIYGIVPSQTAISKTYTFTLNAFQAYANYTESQSFRAFTIKIIGEIDSVINWNTLPNLGIINAGFISTVSVNATSTVPNAILIYELISGVLPPGLSLNADGEIIGKVNLNGLTSFSDSTFTNQTFDNNTTTLDRVFNFTILARDQFNYSAVSREFSILIDVTDTIAFSNVRVKPYLKLDQRAIWKSFISNPAIFTPGSIYRSNDTNFGIQPELSMLVYAGIETVSAAQYISAMGLNNKRKQFRFGDVKKAVAIVPGTRTEVYEVIYVQMSDPLEYNGQYLPNKITNVSTTNTSKQLTVDNSVTFWDGGFFKNNPLTNDQLDQTSKMAIPAPDAPRPDSMLTIDSTGYMISDPTPETYFPSSISIWRDKINTIGSSERNYLPLWMRSIQPGTRQEINFTLAVPLCYCKLGTADGIILNIKHSNFDFKLLDYTADRYIIDLSYDETSDKYFVFKNDRITV